MFHIPQEDLNRAADSNNVWYKVAQQNSLHALSMDIQWREMERDWAIQAIVKVLSTPLLKYYQRPFCGLQLSRDSLFASLFADHCPTSSSSS